MRQYVQKRFRNGAWLVAGAVIVGVIALIGPLLPSPGVYGTNEKDTVCEEVFCELMPRDDTAVATLEVLQPPEIAKPDWLQTQEAERSVTVTYQVETRGDVVTSVEQFERLVAETFADKRGWSRLGVEFQQVESGGQFTLVLSEASQLPSFSPGCDTEYSCRAGQYVIINESRWLSATDSWNEQGGSLRDYQHMVINHETGHWLGHGHYQCQGAGQPAPVMQQQSIDLQGCTFNPWPVEFELTSSQLGL